MPIIIIKVIALFAFAISSYKAYLHIKDAAGFYDIYISKRERNKYHADEYKNEAIMSSHQV